MDRRGDRPGGGGGDRGGGSGGDVGRRMPSRWSSGSPTNDNFPPRGGDRFPRGEGRGGGGFGGGGGGGGGRFHPYRGPQDYPAGGGAGGPGFRGGPGGFGHQGPMGGGGGGPKRGFFGRGGSPDYADGNKVAKLFIGSVPRTATEEDIRPLFEEHGNVIEVALIRDRRTGQQQGFCFIKYATTEEADRAIAALHNQYTLPGAVAPLQVRYADGDRERHGPVEDKLFVASLNKRATEQEIAEIFTPYGHVEDVYLMRDDLKQSRGCGFVKFASRDMAAAAMNALHGTYTMRGCDQPLIVRFADPKRPRPDPRGGPAFGGPGFGHRSEESTMARPPSNFDVPMGGRLPPNAWGPVSPQPNGPSSLSRTHGFGSNSSAKGGGAMETSSPAAGSFGDTGGPASGSQPNLAATPLSQQGFNPPMGQTNPAVGQQMPPLQKSFVPSQHLPTSMQPHNNQNFASYSQGHALQAPMQQLGQHQFPHSIGLPSNQTVPSQQLPGLAGQLSTSQPLIQQNASAAGTQNQLGLQQQGMAAVANQQQMPASSISHQLHQRPVQQLPSQFPQALLQQQAQALQSSFQSSQQALLQLQQQVQLMQQSSQQQFSQNAKQQSTWSGPHTTSGTPVSAPAVVMPSAASATSVPVTTASVVPLTCNWTEHTSPEGFKYYYNGVTGESKWEKPEEYLIFEQQQQQQQQQKLLLLQQQQQKLAVQQLQSPAQTTSDSQVHPTQQVSQTQQQVMSQMQLRQQAQLQLLQPSLAYQASGATGNPSVQGFNYAQLQAVGSVTDPARFQQGQGVQAAPDAWQTKPAGS